MAEPLRFGQIRFAASERFFRALPLRQVEHEGHAFVAAVFESGVANEDQHATAVLAEVLLLIVSHGSSPPELLEPLFVTRLDPFGGCHVSPGEAAAEEILSLVSYDPEKRVVGIEYPSVEIPNEDSDDVGVDHATNSGFAFGELSIEIGIFQRDRGLRGEQLQHRDTGWREHPRGQAILQIQNADELGLFNERQAENGPTMTVADVRVFGKRGPGRGVVEYDVVPGALDIGQHRLRQRDCRHGLVAHTHDHFVAARRGLRRDPQLGSARQSQQSALCARLLDRRAHDRVDQFFELNLARSGL